MHAWLCMLVAGGSAVHCDLLATRRRMPLCNDWDQRDCACSALPKNADLNIKVADSAG